LLAERPLISFTIKRKEKKEERREEKKKELVRGVPMQVIILGFSFGNSP